mmetsp:Transcript_13130/g.39692  ORF Transcript_13130/g.39692 Transcript_13130/m.39692 type:complete len:931 (-) Transcript_13130:84-2876(-)
MSDVEAARDHPRMADHPVASTSTQRFAAYGLNSASSGSTSAALTAAMSERLDSSNNNASAGGLVPRRVLLNAEGGAQFANRRFRCFRSADVQLPLLCKVVRLIGEVDPSESIFPLQEILSDSPQAYQRGVTRPCVSVQCSIATDGDVLSPPIHTKLRGEPFQFREWIHFPMRYADLPLRSHLVVDVLMCDGPRHRKLVAGAAFPLFTRSRALHTGRQLIPLRRHQPGSCVHESRLEHDNELYRLGRLRKQHMRGNIPEVSWLDSLTFARICTIEQEQYQSRCFPNASCTQTVGELLLEVELPTFELPIQFYEQQESISAQLRSKSYYGKDARVRKDPQPKKGARTIDQLEPQSAFGDFFKVVDVVDAELDLPNPVDIKHSKLVKSYHNRQYFRDLKPTATERKLIETIIRYPPGRTLTVKESDMLWRFRYYLKDYANALTRFLKSVEWQDPKIAAAAIDILNQWEPIPFSAALELLTPSFKQPEVRAYAVSRLEPATDDQLLSFLLQLVQALRHEYGDESPLFSFLVRRAQRTKEVANFLYWYLRLESEDNIANKSKDFFVTKTRELVSQLKRSQDGQRMIAEFNRQQELTTSLCEIQEMLRPLKDCQDKRTRLVSLLQKEFAHLSSFPPLRLPVNPRIFVTGIIPEMSRVFKSAMKPLGLTFHTITKEQYTLIFKSGDDMRQDQFVIQFVRLMDHLLKKQGLDLKLSPYPVLANSWSEGFVEAVIPSITVGRILKKYGSIQRYLLAKCPSTKRPDTILPSALDNYIKSTAGYCVITYILGIGDRHLDNLLLTDDGRLFHIDFGYILGLEPPSKSLLRTTPIRLSKEMVDAMGREGYIRFKEHACGAYNILRQSANLLLNLFSLMLHAGLPDIETVGREAAMLKIQEKFRLDLSDAEASQAFQTVITSSVSAIYPRLTEWAHQMAQAMAR